MIEFKRSTDLSKSAAITHRNMRSYYEYYSVDWGQEKILEQIGGVDNWDILNHGEVVGALRLSFDGNECYLRDLQVSEKFQNKGIGTKALMESKQQALEVGSSKLKLKVFKISPAHRLYEKNGFTVTHEDEKFYYMEQGIV